MTDDDLWTADEVAVYLRRSYKRTVELLGGEIPSNKRTGRWLTRKADIDAWLRKTQTTGKTRRRGRARTP